MKVTRVISLAVAAVAVAAILAGVTGVWSPRSKPPPETQEDIREAPKDVIVIERFRVTQGGLDLRAPVAWMKLNGDSRLFSPTFELKLAERPKEKPKEKPKKKPPTGGRVTRLRGRANEGTQSAKAKDVVELRGDVVITASGAREGVVRAPELAMNTKTRKGQATGKVTFEFRTRQGLQSGSCENAEWSVQERKGTLLSKCRLVLNGWRMIDVADGADPAGAEKAPPPPIEVTCAGRADVDLLNGVTQLHRDAHVRQDKAEMTSDLLTLRFDRAERQIRRVEAVGNVRFSDPSMGLKGKGDKLTVLAEDRCIEIEGKPVCRLEVTGAVLTAPKVRLRGRQVECLGPGSMTPTAPSAGQAPARAVRVRWTKRMLYRRDRGAAEFWGGVTLVEGANRLACRQMRVAFSEKDRRPRRVEAVGKVVFRTAAGVQSGESELACDRMIVAFAKDSGQLAKVEAEGNVESAMAARPGEKPSRITCRRMSLAFGPDGRTATGVAADGDVSFRGPEGRGSASHLELDPKSDRVTLVGDPAKLTDKAGQSLAGKSIRIDRKLGVVESDKPGVFTARMVGATSPAVGAPKGKGTLRAEWRKRMRYWIEPGRALLEGKVDIRLGRNRLSSDWVDIRRPEERLDTRGPGELTVAVPDDGKAPAAAKSSPLAAAKANGAKAGEPLRIAWRKGMTYDGRRREAVFTGKASLKHGPYALEADTLTAYLDEQRNLDRGVARGAVRCRDTSKGYRGRGERLDWSPKTGVATLRGSKGKPAELSQTGGEAIQAEKFVFSDDFRKIRVEGMRLRPDAD